MPGDEPHIVHGISRRESVVGKRLIYCAGIGVSVGHVGNPEWRLNPKVIVNLTSKAVVAATFSGDHYNAVSTPIPIKGQRGGILENRDAFHLFRADLRHVAFDAVNEHQNLIAAE